MTVESLINILDKKVIFQIIQAYDRKMLFDSSRSNNEWENVKDKIVVEIYPTDTRGLCIYVKPDWIK